jgi:carboxy-terminal domain RNA polymerase II polypeptide A small phosphatase
MQDKSDKLIILDLDETLIYATQSELEIPCDFKFDRYFVYKRPYVEQFLTDISKHFSVGIWSSAGDDYVNEIVRHIKPNNVDFVVVWGRSKCSLRRDLTFDTYCFEKRLDKLKKKGFKLEQILVVDDSPEKSRTNYGNAVHIKEFTGDLDDNELQVLYNYLLTFKSTENVRTIEKRRWRQRNM